MSAGPCRGFGRRKRHWRRADVVHPCLFFLYSTREANEVKHPPLNYVQPLVSYSDDGLTCRIRVPCHVPTGNDLLRMHHHQRHKVALRQQEAVFLTLLSHCREWTREPTKRHEITRLTLTRLSPRRADSDKGVVLALAAVLDVTAAWIVLGNDIRTRNLGMYDDIVKGGASPRSYLTVQYTQALGPIGPGGKRGYGVELELERSPGFVPQPRAARKIVVAHK
jgi:hypothetical protein